MASPQQPYCSACSVEMELAMIIPPFRTPYGLKIYTCPKCGRSEDYLIDPASKAARLSEAAAEETMNPADEFLKRALDCQRMAKFARDTQSRATWLRMAERWRLCAEKFASNQTLAARREPPKRRPMSAAG